jgi:hypothetical protein
VEVQEEENRRGYLKFLDNYAVLTIEEGEISAEEIVDNLKQQFDQKWHWQLREIEEYRFLVRLREIEEYRFLVRFPSHKQIASTLISDITYFRMKKEGVLISLKAWTGDFEPYEAFEETWIQIRGVPLSGATGRCSAKLHIPLAGWWR